MFFCLSNRSESRIQQLQSQFSQSQAARESAVSQSRHLQSLIEEYFLMNRSDSSYRQKRSQAALQQQLQDMTMRCRVCVGRSVDGVER